MVKCDVIFSQVFDLIRTTHPHLNFHEIAKKIGEMWSNLTDKEKKRYVDEYEAEKVNKYKDNLTKQYN